MPGTHGSRKDFFFFFFLLTNSCKFEGFLVLLNSHLSKIALKKVER